jgi:Domain of unknown function (DUF6268)
MPNTPTIDRRLEDEGCSMQSVSSPVRYSVLPAAVLLVMAGTALAQDATVIPDPEPTGQAPATSAPMKFGLGAGEYWFDIRSQYAPTGEIGDGEVNTWRSTAELGVMYPLGQRNRLWVNFRSEYTNSDFKSIHGLTPDGDLYNDLTEYTLGVRSMTHLTGPWSLLVGASATSAGEAHAEIDQSLTYRGAAGLSYAVNQNLQIGLMAGIATRLEEDTSFFPFPVIELNYQFSERWRAEVSTFSGGKVVFSPDNDLDVSLGVDWFFTEYRLDHDGPFEGGVFRQTRVPISLRADWQFRPQYTLNASIGVNVVNNWEFVDDNGNDLIDEDIGTDIFAGVGIRVTF